MSLKVIVIPREKLITDRFSDLRGNHCALAWLIVRRGADMEKIVMGGKQCAAECERVFPDIKKKLGGRKPSNEWSGRVIDANNNLDGVAREKKLIALFKEAGLTLRFTGQAER